MKTQLHGLDHLRALAIVMVFVYHYSRVFPHPGWTEGIGRFGWTGVDLFFVLSGFLIASQVFKNIVDGKKISLKDFFIKRFFRIIPGYLFVVGLYFIFPIVRERESLAPLWKYLTFTQNIGLDLSKNGTFSHAWSLCIEEQFYLLFPVIVILLVRFKAFKLGVTTLFLLFLLSFTLRLYSWQVLVSPFAEDEHFFAIWYKWIYYPTWCRTDGLIIGVGIAALAQFKPGLMARIQQYGNWWLLLSVLILTAAWFVCCDLETFNASVFGFPIVDIGYGFMVLAAVSQPCFLYKFRSGITVTIATLSYAIYLSHKIVIHVMQMQLAKFSITINSNLMMVLCTAGCLLFAFGMNLIIERPFLRWRNRVLNNEPRY